MQKVVTVFILVFAFVQIALAQNPTKRSYEKAREVVDKAVIAYGGVQNLTSIENFSLKAVGETVQRNQSRRTFSFDRTPYQIDLVIDITNNRLSQVVQGGYPGGFKYHSGFAVDKTDGVGFDLIRQTSTLRPNSPPAAFRQRQRYLPQFWILNLLERASRLRYLGKAEFDKRPHTIISYANEDGGEISLYFDDKTNLLSKTETLFTDVYFGDSIQEAIFTGYRSENGHQIPTGRTIKTNDELNEETRYEQVAFNVALNDSQFKAPSNFQNVASVTPPPVTKYSDSVYTVNAGGYNVLFVAFKDFVFVMETPGSDNVSRQAINQIKQTFPDKPIRYVAVTHHHDDHAGGIRAYIAEGATIIAAPGEKSFFEQVAKSKFTINPDSLARNPQPLKIETIEKGKRIITDGTQTIEIHDIGSGPHAEEMLVAYLPNEKLVYQGDLLNNPPNGDYAIANDTSAHFAKWLTTKGLVIDKIVPVHGTPQTMDALRQAVAKMTKE